MIDVIQQFKKAISENGLTPPEVILTGSKFHHFSTNGKKGDTSGWYRLHLDGIPAGSFGCYRSGIIKTWCSKSRNEMTPDEWTSHVSVLESMAKQKEEDAQIKASRASIEAQERWGKAKPADDNHPYLLAKSVKSFGLKVENDNLLLKIFNLSDKTITSLQTISPIGEKRFMKDGIKRGGIFLITSEDYPKEKVVICEGYATGASIFEATGLTVAVAFDAGNLLPVAEAIRAIRQDLKLIIAADDDWKSDINTGETKAKEASQKVGGYLAVPYFPSNRGEKDSDFNDMARLYGLDSIKACIENAEKIEMGISDELIPDELLQTVRIDDVLTQLPPAPSFVWDCYVPRKEVTLFSGHGSVGKSWIALMLAVSGALGRPLFGREVQRSKTIFVSLEDDSDVVRYRLSVICLKWGVSTSSLDGWLWVVDGTQIPELYLSINRNKGELTATYQQLSQKAKEFDAGLVIVDNASDAYGGDEIQRKTVREFIRSLAKIAKSTNGGFVLLAHVDKDTAKGKFINAEGYSGSTAWHNSARSRLLLKRDTDGTLTLEHQKGNHSNGLQEPILLEWLPDELPKLMGDCVDLTPLLNGVARSADEGKAKVLLGLIEEFASRGQYCTPNMTSHSKVHKVLKSDPEFKKLKLFPDDTQRIVTQCQRAGWLDIEQYTGTSRNKKEKWVLTETGKTFAGLEEVASNALNASNTLINADEGIDAPASNIVGGMGEFTHAPDSTHQTNKKGRVGLD
jgi:phage/plasmid primase-like uncharacterized protein